MPEESQESRQQYRREYYRKNRKKAIDYQNAYRKKYFVREKKQTGRSTDCPDYVREKVKESYTHQSLMRLPIIKFAKVIEQVAEGKIELVKV